MNDEERFDPSRHSLADAAERLKQISEKDYTARIAKALGRHEEENTNELATGGVIENHPIMFGDGSPEIVFTPVHTNVFPTAGTMPNTGYFTDLAEKIATLKEEQERVETERLRKVVREEVHRAIYPTAGMADAHQHRRIEMVEENGTRWRGVLYAVEDEHV